MVNDMKEVEHRGRDKFVPRDVTVSVNCKPKHIYPSSVTNWANDLFANRYVFQNDHEMPLEGVSETAVLDNRDFKIGDYGLPTVGREAFETGTRQRVLP